MEADANMNKQEMRLLKQSYWGGVFRSLRKDKRAMIALVILVLIVAACLLVPVFSPYTMRMTNVLDSDLPPSAKHWFGTDKIGRDLFTRLFYGGRISLGLALIVTAAETILGVILGSLAGYYGKIVDAVIMRLADVFSSFPLLMMAITMMVLLPTESSELKLVITLTILMWPGIARLVRGQILVLREQEYMEACEALGINDFKRIFRHLLPNVLSYVVVYATMGMASVILVETSMSFLGVGVSPPTPTWGNMINEARNILIIVGRWWIWIPPSIAIFATVMCFNLLGEGLRDAIDPKMKR